MNGTHALNAKSRTKTILLALREMFRCRKKKKSYNALNANQHKLIGFITQDHLLYLSAGTGNVKIANISLTLDKV